jgi:hypothetical protein
MLKKMFMQPYMDADDGLNLGGGGEPSPTPEPTPIPEPTPEPQGGNEPEPSPLPQSIKVKFNHQEVELPYEEAVTHIQKGMNFDKAVERARQEAALEARDSWIAEQGYEWKGKPIKTEVEYKEALREQELENKIRSQYANVPDEIINELTESRKFREQYQTKEQQLEAKTKTDQMYQEFADAYPDLKGDEIPPEVWKEVQNGKNLLDAYVRHENKILRDQLNGVQAKDQAAQANQANANSSTGSARGQGTPTSGFISKEAYEANKHDQGWMMKNYDPIKQSMSKWGK